MIAPRRSLWHLGCCIATLYILTSILQIKSENLPQWLPTAINCGLGASVGLQNIPSNSRKRLGEYVSSILSSIFGGTQVNIWGERGQEDVLPRVEPRVDEHGRRREDVDR
jgi:hypothetical protein